MRRPSRPRRRLVVAFALAAVAFGVVPGLVRSVAGGSGGSAPLASTAGQPAAASQLAGAGRLAGVGRSDWAGARPVSAATLTSANEPDGGICSVPGIGDIGGLLGFCSLGTSGVTGDLNNLCEPSVPQPESASTGVDSLVSPPAPVGKPLATPYNQYGMAGQYWAATNLQCSDMTSLIGNDVAGMIFDFAKALDRLTITIYQSAAGEGILGWLQNVTDHLISGIGNAIYFPYLAVVVILAAIWMAWQGLFRKRATRTIEGTIWMVMACLAAVWLIGRPGDFTGLGKGVSDGISTALNAAFAHLPSPGQAGCLPVRSNDPQISPSSYSYTSGRTVVDQNANELWTVLVCKPWLDGEFGTTAFSTGSAKPTLVNTYARQLLWAQAIAVNERPTPALITAKQAAYTGIATTIQQRDPSAYPLFQGKEWTTRLEIAFSALLAAVVAGVLVLLISVTLILLKLGFLLLLIVGPFFLLVGIHPGFGRVVAVRWFEMLIGVLLKQAAVALALSVLLYCYALIMGTSDAVLPWALKILMITLVTVAVFIYRKPFQHLFAAVGYGAIGSTDRAEAESSRAATLARANTMAAATLAVPGVAAYRAARWARRNPAQAAGLALGATTALGAASSVSAGANGAGGASDGAAYGTGAAAGGGSLGAGAGAGVGGAGGASVGGGASARARAWGASSGTASAGTASGRQAPPLRLSPRHGGSASWASGGGRGSAGSGGSGGSGAPSAPALPLNRSSGGPGGSGGPVPGAPRQAPPERRSPAPKPGSPAQAPPAQPRQGGHGQPAAPRSARQPHGRRWQGGAGSPGASDQGGSGRRGWAEREDRQDRGGWSGRSGGSGRSGDDDGAGAFWAADPPGADDGAAGPFWLRPMRRRR